MPAAKRRKTKAVKAPKENKCHWTSYVSLLISTLALAFSYNAYYGKQSDASTRVEIFLEPVRRVSGSLETFKKLEDVEVLKFYVGLLENMLNSASKSLELERENLNVKDYQLYWVEITNAKIDLQMAENLIKHGDVQVLEDVLEKSHELFNEVGKDQFKKDYYNRLYDK